MKKYIIIAILSSSIIFLPTYNAASYTDVVDLVINSCVTIIMSDGSCGSGFVIGPGTIMTARHVVGDNTSGFIIFPGSELPYPITETWSSENEDVAVVTYIGPDVTQLQFATYGELKVGQEIFVIGSPSGVEVLRNYVSAGVIGGLHRNIGGPFGTNMLLTDAAINPGNSGGAMFNMNGKIVGMATVTFTSIDSVSGGLPVEVLLSALKEYGLRQRSISW